MRGFLSAFAVFCAVALPAAAFASTITETIDFTASGTADVTASYTITFDPTLDYTDESTGLTVNSMSYFASPLPAVFTYSASVQFFFIGGAVNGAAGVSFSVPDYIFVVFNPQTSPQFAGFDYSDGITHGSDSDGTVKITSATTPEPSSFVLFGTGVFGLAGAARRRFLKA